MSQRETASAEAAKPTTSLNAVEVLELTTDCFLALDSDFRITYLNEAAARLGNVSLSEVLGRSVWEQWPAALGTPIESNYRLAMETREPVHFEHHYQEPGAFDLWLEIHAYPTQTGLAIFFRDITSKKNDEEALRASLAREEAKVEELHVLMDSVPAAIWIMEDKEGNRITGSRLSYNLLRLQEGANASLTAPEGERPSHFRACSGIREMKPDELPVQRAAWENREIRGAEFDIVFEDGNRIHFYGNAVPLRNAQGEARGSIAAFLDVTELKRTQAELRRSLSRLELTLGAAHAGTWEWEAETEDRKWSPEFYDIFGIDPMLRPTRELAVDRIHPEDLDHFMESVTIWRSGVSYQLEFRIQHPKKGLRWLEMFGRPLLSADGSVKTVVGIVLDITDRKLAEVELERRVQTRTEELVAANKEMEGFTYSVSHDLRAPLRAIVANSRMLLDDLGEKMDEEHRHMLERQSANANKLGQLIDDLLKMSRLGRQEMVMAELDLSALAETEAEEIARTHGESLDIEVEPDMRVSGDEKLVRFLLQNLIGNAYKFSPKGGKVQVGKKLLESGETAFFVRDEGIGFDMSYLTKLYHPFERLVTDKEFPGTGIGLANVKRIASRHGGRVWAESAGEGQGSTFWFTLAPSED